ncbi:hypothetical protein [Streptococcus suis]|uniref:hypothetical protein n=1 Tax=Streptococcus suis TaxID=1307 RepID=UPI0005CCF92F|nr:hypothetical protein [Streptococcus suis]CYV61411.1 Uncharacterised protein [Streptococcus suis]
MASIYELTGIFKQIAEMEGIDEETKNLLIGRNNLKKRLKTPSRSSRTKKLRRNSSKKKLTV